MHVGTPVVSYKRRVLNGPRPIIHNKISVLLIIEADQKEATNPPLSSKTVLK